ncbi:MAG: hypothetical protein ACI82A_001857 [Candidatus Azotimanducaceae bacterium]|jgi:hypothetical protein
MPKISVKLLMLAWLVLQFSSAMAVTVSVRVEADNDDAQERIADGDMYRDSSDLEMGFDALVGGLQIVGMRFRNVAIPQGSIVNSAYLEFETDETNSGATSLVIFGENVDTANEFGISNDDISTRPKTSASANWSPGAWSSTNELHQTPDIASIIKEIVDRTGWSSGNDLVIMIEPDGSCINSNCQRTAESHDGEAGAAPLLVLDYSTGASPPALQCRATFTDGLTNSDSGGNIKFENSAQLLNNPDTTLGTTQIDNDGTVLSCNSANCSASGTIVPQLNSRYIGHSSNTNFDVNGNTQTITANDYKDVKVKSGGSLFMSATFSSYHFRKLKVESNSVIYLTPGDYFLEEIEIKGTSQLIVQGSGTARIYVKNKAKFRESSVINGGQSGDPSKLVVYFFAEDDDQIIVEGAASVAGYLYSEGKVAIEDNNSSVLGAISSVGELKLKNDSSVTYDDSIDDTDFGDMCGESPPPTPVIDYHFDESAWNGTANEVADSSGNSMHALANTASGLTTVDLGQVCRAGQFDGTNDYIESSSIFSYLRTTASLSFWIKTTQTGDDTAWQAPGVTGVEQSGGSDDIFWGWLDATGRIGISVTDDHSSKSTVAINNGVYRHIVLTRDSATGAYKIYVDGILDNSGTIGTGDIGTSFSSIGRIEDTGGTPEYLLGDLDEIVVFDSVLSNSQVSTIYTEQLAENNYDGSTRTCLPISASVHHYEIVHDGQGLTCDAEVVAIKACNEATCSSLSTEVTTLDLLANGAIVGSPTFTGSTTVNFNNTTVETLTLSVANTSIAASNTVVCDAGSSNSCDISFTDAGFRFLYSASNSTTLPNQISGTVFGDTLKLQAVKDTDGACTGLFTGNTNVDLSQENVDPGGTSGLSFSIDSNSIAKHSTFTSIPLIFGTESIATIPTPRYFDAGQIRLRASYDLAGVTLFGSSNTFWVSPAELVVNATLGTTVLNGASETAAPTHKAGENFELGLSAFNSVGVITPNYSPGQIQLKPIRTGPTIAGSVDGNVTYAASSAMTTSISASAAFQNVTLTSFSSGVSTYNAAQYSEVGLISLEVQDNNYGNASIVVPATPINIGRFIPEHFKQTVAQDGFFHTTCGSRIMFSAYSGQKDEASGSTGAISYLTNPILAITAYNKQDDITQNYYEDSDGSVNDYMKLTSSSVGITVPTLDEVAIGLDTNRLPLTASINTGTLSQNDLTALPSVVALPKGVLHYQLSINDHFFYNRSSNALVAPFTSDIDFSIASITDADNVNVTTTVDASPTGVEILFGRLRLENSFGPETSNFPQPMEVEHFDGAGFIVTSTNSCTGYDPSKISLTNISLDPALTNVLGVTGNFLVGKTQEIELEAPGPGNQGGIGVLYDAFDWLKYDWDNGGAYDDNPSALATFGIFRGDDRVIYWREVYK